MPGNSIIKEVIYFLVSEEIESANKKIFTEKAVKLMGQEYLEKAYFEKWDEKLKMKK